MNDQITTIAPVYISDKVTLHEQLSHVRDILSSVTGASFTEKSDHYPSLIEVLHNIGGMFRVKDKSKIESVMYNLITCCEDIPGSYRTEFFNTLCQGFKAESSKADVNIRLEYLELFFISFPESERGKSQLLRAYLELCKQYNAYSRLSWITLSNLKKWCSQWGLQLDREKYELLSLAKDCLKAAGRELEALEILVDINASFPPNTIKELAIELICTVLNKPDEFYLDEYNRLPTIQEEKIINTPDLYQLFQIMLTYHYSDYKKFLDNHPNTLTDFKLDPVILENKIKLLTLVDLGAKSTIVSFDHIARSLDLTANQVDALVIEAVKFGLCQARIDEMAETVQFLHVPARIFNIEQWKYLHARLEQFRSLLTTLPSDLKLS
ncbi:hypothetical protein LOD99_12261 [Oopsacas minuta]|uniref:PCI domain-containing protein n=1 Tax=Oopsacas minuta TaxID=111878 RepID=A0AAV7JEN8_9METZ|nr:hypothetical protein LOD99_12261 [Oopsacas minuta]